MYWGDKIINDLLGIDILLRLEVIINLKELKLYLSVSLL